MQFVKRKLAICAKKDPCEHIHGLYKAYDGVLHPYRITNNIHHFTQFVKHFLHRNTQSPVVIPQPARLAWVLCG